MGTARCWIELAVVVLAVPLLVWIPGLLAALHLSFLDPEERAAVAGSFGLALVGASAFVAHVSPAPPAVVNAVVWTVAVVLGLVSARAARRPLRTAVSWPRLGWWALFYLALVGLQGMSPIYAGGNWYGDWWEHYSIAQAYAGTAGGRSSTWFAYYNLASRTPLFNLGAAFCLSLFGDRFWVYQVFSTALSSLFVLPLHLLTRELMGRRAALLAAVFVFFDTWLVHDAMFTWSKMTTAYLLLLALHFHLRLRAGAGAPALYLATWCGALAVMAHQSAAYYLAGLALSHGLLRPRPAPTPRQASVAAAIAAVVVVPWHWWVSRLFGVTGVVRANPVLSTGRPTVGRLLGGGVENAVTSLV